MDMVTIVIKRMIRIDRPMVVFVLEENKGPSIKYVTLEGRGGPRRCDSL